MRKAEKSVHEKPAALLYLIPEMKIKSTFVFCTLQGSQKVFERPDSTTLREVTESQTFVYSLLAVTVYSPSSREAAVLACRSSHEEEVVAAESTLHPVPVHH